MNTPTPEQLAHSENDIIRLAKEMLLDDLIFYGYQIVHPDDVETCTYCERNLQTQPPKDTP